MGKYSQLEKQEQCAWKKLPCQRQHIQNRKVFLDQRKSFGCLIQDWLWLRLSPESSFLHQPFVCSLRICFTLHSHATKGQLLSMGSCGPYFRYSFCNEMLLLEVAIFFPNRNSCMAGQETNECNFP